MHINDIRSNDVVIFNDTLTTLGLTQHVVTSIMLRATCLISSSLKKQQASNSLHAK